jgi:hypothetical protein
MKLAHRQIALQELVHQMIATVMNAAQVTMMMVLQPLIQPLLCVKTMIASLSHQLNQKLP